MSNKTPELFRIFIPVADSEASKAFYEKLLGIKANVIHGGRGYLYCGPVILAILENHGTPIADHLYFSVEHLDEVFERAKELSCLEDGEVHGAPAGEIVVRPWRERSFYARDPWSNGLCFVDSTTLFTGKR